MGAASSIQSTEYDEEKFEASRKVMEHCTSDEEKFEKLKEIWNIPDTSVVETPTLTIENTSISA